MQATDLLSRSGRTMLSPAHIGFIVDTEQQKPIHRFGVFELDMRAGELRKYGVRLKLQQQPLQVLSIFLERAGEVVTREDIQKRLSPDDTYVDFDNDQ